jgi:predicted XRE-type DNA-binding protein
MSTRTALTKGSRNVFADLGFAEGEAQNLALRSDLIIRIEKLVQDCGMTQQQAAKTLGVTQPRFNTLLKGKIADFSLDALVNRAAPCGHASEDDRQKSCVSEDFHDPDARAYRVQSAGIDLLFIPFLTSLP